MKSLTIAIIMTLALVLSATYSSSAQATVTGHVSAEIVEAVSVSSNATTDITIHNHTAANHNSLNLGNITVKSGSSVSCNIVINPATVSSRSGNSFTLVPSAGISNTLYGNNTLALKGIAEMQSDTSSGEYKGSYSIIFAYN